MMKHRPRCWGLKKLRRDESGLSRKIVAIFVIALIVVASLAAILLLLQKAPVEEEVLPPAALAMKENMEILENGDATLERSLTVSTPALADVYRKAFAPPEDIPPPKPVDFTITHTTDNEFLTGVLENLTVENDEVKLSFLEVEVYRPSGALTSAELFFGNLTSATATWNADVLPKLTTVTVKLSNDNGLTWESVDNNVSHTFSLPGSVLRYKIVLETESLSMTPKLYDITLAFTLQLQLENVMNPDQMFTEEIQNEYKTLLGLDATVTGFEKTLADKENRFLASLDVYVRGAAKYDLENQLWEVDIGPQTEDDRAAAIGYMLTQMMFIQQMLENLGENVYEHTSSTPVTLPAGAKNVNWDELSGLSWHVDFGGGSYRKASVAVDITLRKVTLNEKVVITRQPLTVSPDEFLENLSGYKIFTIKYQLGGGGFMGLESGSGQPGSGGESLSLGDSGAKGGSSNWSKSWTRSISYTFSKTFTWSGTYGGASASASATISATPSLTATFYIGWSFKDWWSPKLQWFRTYVSVNPSLTVSFNASVTAGVTKSWSHTFDAYSHTFWFWIGPVPVWADLDLDVIPGVDLSANATCTLSARVGVSVTGKFGVEWIRGTGWRPIKELSRSQWRSGPTLTGSASITTTPYVELRLGFYLYSVAGPYASFKPKGRLQVLYPQRTWSITVGFEVGAGVGMGKLGRWVGLPSWGTTLYDFWVTPPIWSGTW